MDMDINEVFADDQGEILERSALNDLLTVTPSPAERQGMLRAEHGRMNIMERMSNGSIRPQDGQAILQAMMALSGPAKIKASQLPIMQRRFQMIQAARAFAEKEKMVQESAAFRARSLQDRVAEVNGVRYLETRPGQWEPLPSAIQPATEQARTDRLRVQREESRRQEVGRLAAEFRRTERAAGREPTQPQIVQYVRDHIGGLDAITEEVRPRTAAEQREAAGAGIGRETALGAAGVDRATGRVALPEWYRTQATAIRTHLASPATGPEDLRARPALQADVELLDDLLSLPGWTDAQAAQAAAAHARVRAWRPPTPRTVTPAPATLHASTIGGGPRGAWPETAPGYIGGR